MVSFQTPGHAQIYAYSANSIICLNIHSHFTGKCIQDNIFNLPSYSSKIQYNTNKSYETMSYKFLEDKFTKYFNDSGKASELLEFLKNERKCEHKISLKRQ